MDGVNLLDGFLGFLEEHDIRYCVIGGQAVNAYVEPLVSLDLDVAVAVTGVQELACLLRRSFAVCVHPHSLNLSAQGSDLRIQVQTDERYASFVPRGETREVLGRSMQVARLSDVLQGKVWAASDSDRRASKRQKDLADIARILDAYPELRASIPAEILSRLL